MFHNWHLRFPNFEPEELCSPKTLERYSHIVDLNWFDVIQEFRIFLDSPLIVNTNNHRLRGSRTVTENLMLKKTITSTAVQSMHCLCRACDISAPGITINELNQKASAFNLIKQNAFGGIGMYDSWLHVDGRILTHKNPFITRWDNRTKK